MDPLGNTFCLCQAPALPSLVLSVANNKTDVNPKTGNVDSETHWNGTGDHSVSWHVGAGAKPSLQDKKLATHTLGKRVPHHHRIRNPSRECTLCHGSRRLHIRGTMLLQQQCIIIISHIIHTSISIMPHSNPRGIRLAAFASSGWSQQSSLDYSCGKANF